MHNNFLGLYFCNSILHVVGWKITLTVTTPLSTAVNIPVCLIILYVSELRCIRPPVKKKEREFMNQTSEYCVDCWLGHIL